MKIRAFLYDFARNQTLNMDYIKYVIDILSEFNYNMMLINLEYRFDFSSCPGIAAKNPITHEAAREIADYGKEKGIEIVPLVNFLGHCEGITAIELYKHLGCDPYQMGEGTPSEQLNLNIPEARRLVSKMFKDICRAFPGKYLHTGLDEVRRTSALFPDDPEKAEKTLQAHFQYILELARKTKRQVMIWGDMPLQKEWLIAHIPKDVIICDWYYAPDGRKESLEKYKKEGFRVLACPAVNTGWTLNLHPDISYSNISKMLNYSKELGLEGYILTSWGFAHGKGMGIIWPWVAMAAAVSEGEKIGKSENFVSGFASDFYHVDGKMFLRLHEILCSEMEKLFELKTFSDEIVRGDLSIIGNALFRGIYCKPYDKNNRASKTSNTPWVPSPFSCWLYLRRFLENGGKFTRLKKLSEEALLLANELGSQAGKNKSQLKALLNQAKALHVMVFNFNILELAQKNYHDAAIFQQKGDKVAFDKKLSDTAELLRKIYPQIKILKKIIKENISVYGLDRAELSWMRCQRKSLKEHITALGKMKSDGEFLLEFGEFLRRPVGVSQRVIYR